MALKFISEFLTLKNVPLTRECHLQVWSFRLNLNYITESVMSLNFDYVRFDSTDKNAVLTVFLINERCLLEKNSKKRFTFWFFKNCPAIWLSPSSPFPTDFCFSFNDVCNLFLWSYPTVAFPISSSITQHAPLHTSLTFKYQ